MHMYMCITYVYKRIERKKADDKKQMIKSSVLFCVTIAQLWHETYF